MVYLRFHDVVWCSTAQCRTRLEVVCLHFNASLSVDVEVSVLNVPLSTNECVALGLLAFLPQRKAPNQEPTQKVATEDGSWKSWRYVYRGYWTGLRRRPKTKGFSSTCLARLSVAKQTTG